MFTYQQILMQLQFRNQNQLWPQVVEARYHTINS